MVICVDCGERDAAVFMRRASGRPDALDGDLALCEACARARGIVVGPGGLDLRIEGLLDAVIGEMPARANSSRGYSRRVSCPSCGTELSVVTRDGRLGCANCVEAFRPELRRIVASRNASRLVVEVGSVDAAPAYAARTLEEYSRDASDRADMPAAAPFPLGLPAFDFHPDAGSPEDDVVLGTCARVARNLHDLPFPGSPSGGPSPSRGRMAARLAALPGWTVRAMADIQPAVRSLLAERSILPRDYASDRAAVFAASSDAPLYALEDSIDHLRMVARLPGLRPVDASRLALRAAALVLGDDAIRLARDDEFGWLCARIEDCGPGIEVSTLVHLPALALAGLQDGLFRRLMAEGVQVRGVYAEGEASAGSLYQLVATGATGGSPEALSAASAKAALASAVAERLARSEIARRDPDAILDAAGRAVGILAHCRRIGLEEAASLVSALRLAFLSGSLGCADGPSLGRLLERLGPGSLAVASGAAAAPAGAECETLRAAYLHSATRGMAIVAEEGRCSRV